MDGAFSQVIYPLSPPPHPRKRSHLLSDEVNQCRRHVLLFMVAFGTMESGSLEEEEGSLRVPRLSRPSDALGASNVEDYLPAPEVHLDIAIEVVGHLHLAQEMRSLSGEELSLVVFLLD
jgi:hypothetical protein